MPQDDTFVLSPAATLPDSSHFEGYGKGKRRSSTRPVQADSSSAVAFDFHSEDEGSRMSIDEASDRPLSAAPSDDESDFEQGMPDMDLDAAEDNEFKPSKHSKSMPPLSKLPAKTPEELERKIWSQIARVQIPKAAKLRTLTTTSRQVFHKRLSSVVAKEARRGMNKSKSTKEIQSKAKRVMREMLVFWKGNEKRERDGRKVAEKQALDKARKEEELRDAKRAARKLNFLITQTELYSHFVGSKIGSTLLYSVGLALMHDLCSSRSRGKRRDCWSVSTSRRRQGSSTREDHCPSCARWRLSSRGYQL
jgi:hypothetical protein